MANKSNPISQRFATLVEKWDVFSSSDMAKIGIWKVEADEQNMIGLFYQNEVSPEKITFDLFLSFDIPFYDINQYGLDLVKSLFEQLTIFREEHPDISVETNWAPSAFDENKEDAIQYFLANLDAFIESLSDLEDNLVLFLTPSELPDFEIWESWFIKVVEKKMPQRLRFMLIKPLDAVYFKNLEQLFPDEVKGLVADLDIPGAMMEVAASVDPVLPGAKFQKLFLKMTNLISNGKITKGEHKAKEALSIAQQEGWADLQVAVYMVLAGGWLSQQHIENTIKAYDRAISLARNSYQGGKGANAPDAAKLLTQVLFAKSSVFIKEQAFKAAAALYQEVISLSQVSTDVFSELEAWRMTGYCLERLKDYQESMTCYKEAINVGAKMEEKVRTNSTLPYVGQALLDLNNKIGNYEQDQWIRSKMIELVGTDWDAQLQLTKSKNA